MIPIRVLKLKSDCLREEQDEEFCVLKAIKVRMENVGDCTKFPLHINPFLFTLIIGKSTLMWWCASLLNGQGESWRTFWDETEGLFHLATLC